MITFSSFLNWLSGVLGVDSSFLTTLAQVELLESSTNGSGNPPNVSSNAEFTTPPDVDFELPVNSLFGDGFKARIWPKSEFRVESGDLPVAIVLPGTADLNLTCTATDVGVDILAAAFRLELRSSLHVDEVLRPVNPGESVFVVSGGVKVAVGSTGEFEVQIDGQASLTRSQIVGTQVVVAAGKIAFVPADGSGVALLLKTLSIEFPLQTSTHSCVTIALPEGFITANGFSGAVKLSTPVPTYDPAGVGYSGPFSGSIGGIAIGIHDIVVVVQDNIIVENALHACVRLPFFDKTLNVKLEVGVDQSWNLSLATPVAESSVVITLGSAGFGLHLDLMSLELDATGPGPASLTPGGLLQLELFGEKTPKIPLYGFKIKSDGTVDIAGGWLPLESPIPANLGPFAISISRIGFFTAANGRKEIALDAKVNFGADFPAGGSAKGLRISFAPDWSGVPEISFEGIGIKVVRDGFSFEGTVSMQRTKGQTSFAGSIVPTLDSLDATINGQVRIGVKTTEAEGTFPYAALYLDAATETGTPIFGTGLSLYGLAGLLAFNYGPNRKPDQPWYSIEGGDWFHAPPEVGVTSLDKWEAKKGALGLGAGVTIGISGKPKPFNGKFLLLLTLPGPVLLLEGRANLMKDLTALAKHEPMFHALATLDCNVGTLQFGLDAKWRYRDKGELVDLSGGAEAFFDFSDPGAWFLKVGKETPESARVKATLVSYFQANSFLLLDASHARFGGKTGFSVGGKYGPIQLQASLWYETITDISWSPPHLQAQVSLQGNAVAKAFGYGLSLNLAAQASVDAWRPFLVQGTASIAAEVPFYGTAKASVALKWTAPKGGSKPAAGKPLPGPQIALPLTGATLCHPLAAETWPMPVGQWLLPGGLADGNGMLLSTAAVQGGDDGKGPADGGPIVPLDAWIDLQFAQSVDDKIGVAMLSAEQLPATEIGDPSLATEKVTATVRAELVGLDLQRWDADSKSWQAVAALKEGDASAPDAASGLWGVWRPAPPPAPGSNPDGAQRILRLWSADPLSFFNTPSGEAGKQAADDGSAGSTSIPIAYDEVWSLASWPIGSVGGANLTWAPSGGVAPPRASWNVGAQADIALVAFQGKLRHVLRIRKAKPEPPTVVPPGTSSSTARTDPWSTPWAPQVLDDQTVALLQIELASPGIESVRLRCSSGEPGVALGLANGTLVASCNWEPGEHELVLAGPGLNSVMLISGQEFRLIEVRLKGKQSNFLPGGSAKQKPSASFAQHAGLLTAPGHVLPAGARLRLRVRTRVTQSVRAGLSAPAAIALTQDLFFRTQGGPGLADLSLPILDKGADAHALTLHDKQGQAVDVLGRPVSGAPTRASTLLRLDSYVSRALPPRDDAPFAPTRIWRGVDVGFDFSVGNVRALYRSQRRDLALRVRLRSGGRLLDATGEPIPSLPMWLAPTQATTTPEQKAVLQQWQATTGVQLDPDVWGLNDRIRALRSRPLPKNAGLSAELVPLLLCEEPSQLESLPSGWQPLGGATWSTMQEHGDSWLAPSPGGKLVPSLSLPANWSRLVWAGTGGATDVAWGAVDLCLTMRWSAVQDFQTGAGGVLLAADATATSGLALWLEPGSGRRMLLHLVAGKVVAWRADRQGFPVGVDFSVRLRSAEGKLVVSIDDEVVFRVERPELATLSGSVALFASGPTQPRFRAICVEDLRPEAAQSPAEISRGPVLHARPLQTGGFVALPQLAASAPVVATGVDDSESAKAAVANLELKGSVPAPSAPSMPSPEEARRAAALLQKLEPHVETLRSPRVGLDVVDLGKVGGRRAMLLRSCENLDWRRTTLGVRLGTPSGLPREFVGPLRFAPASFDSDGRLCAVSLMVKDPLGSDSLQTSWSGVPDPAGMIAGSGPSLRLGDGAASGVLWRECFASWSLDLWRRDGEVAGLKWQLTNATFGVVGAPADSAGKGTALLCPAPATTDLRLRVRLAATKGACGVVFRHQVMSGSEDGAISRIEWRPEKKGSQRLQAWQRWRDNEGKLHTLTRPLLLPDSVPGWIELDVLASGPSVVVLCNGRLSGGWQDPNPQAGACGAWAYGGSDLQLERFEVASCSTPAVRQRYDDLKLEQCQQQTAPAAQEGPAAWSLKETQEIASIPSFSGAGPAPEAGKSKPTMAFVQSSGMVSVASGKEAPLPASALVLPRSEAIASQPSELLLHVQVRPAAAGRSGVAVGWTADGNAVVVTVDPAKKCAQIDRYAAGSWIAGTSVSANVTAGAWATWLVRVGDRRVTLWVDGVQVITTSFPDGIAGSIALVTDGAKGSEFATPVLLDLTAPVGPWRPELHLGAPPAAPAALASPWASSGRWLQPHWPDGSLPAGWVAATTGQSTWMSYAAEIRIRRTAGACGLLLGWTDGGTGLRLRIEEGATKLESIASGPAASAGADSQATLLASSPLGWKHYGPDVRVEVATSAQRVLVSILGHSLMAPAEDLGPGRIGCWAATDARCWFGDLVVRPASLQDRSLFSTSKSTPPILSKWKSVIVPTVEGKPADWQVQQGQAKWVVEDGELVQLANTLAGSPAAVQPSEVSADALDSGAALWCPKALPPSCCLTLELQNADDDRFGVVFDTAEQGSGKERLLRFDMDKQRGFRRLVAIDEGKPTLLWLSKVGFEPGQWMRLTVVLEPGSIAIWLNGLPLVMVPSQHSPVRMGLYTYASVGARFRNVRILPFDRFANPPAFSDDFSWQSGAWQAGDAAAAWDWVDGALHVKAPANKATELPAVGATIADGRIVAQVQRKAGATTAGMVFRQTAEASLRFEFDDATWRLLRIDGVGAIGTPAPQVVCLTKGTLPAGGASQARLLCIDCIDAVVSVALDGVHLGWADVGKVRKGGISLFSGAGGLATWQKVEFRTAVRTPLGPLLNARSVCEGDTVRLRPAADTVPASVPPCRDFVLPVDCPRPPPGPVQVSVHRPDGSRVAARWMGPEACKGVAASVLRTSDGANVVLSEPSAGTWPSFGVFEVEARRRRGPTSDAQSLAAEPWGGDVEVDVAFVRVDVTKA